MRVALARLLLEQPDLLLMDEPTNHLDLESLIWLEEFLLNWPGALVVISHDRYFLNRMVTHIADLDRGVIDLYAGDYDHYEEEKRQRYEALVNAAKNQQREIDSAEAFIRRFRAKNTKAKQVQQKIRKLERTERIDAPTLERKTIKFRFPQPPRTGRVVAEVKHARKAYGDNVVYKRLDLVVERGEKIALVGPNGAGKSTLLKMLAGVIEPDAGTLTLGHSVRREYFAQHQLEVLHPGQTVSQDHGGGGRPRRAPARGARLPGHVPLRRGRRHQAGGRAFRRGKGEARSWPGCSWTPRGYSCSTNRRTTWTWTRGPSSRRRSASSRARWCSSATTAT